MNTRAAAAAVAILAASALGGEKVTHVGTIEVGYPLRKVVAHPERAEAYGITAGGAVVFMSRDTLSVEKVILTGRVIRDIDVHPDGRHLTVLDNVTGDIWNQPPSVYVLSYDLDTRLQSGILFADAPLYQMAHAANGNISGTSTNQSLEGYIVNGTTGERLSLIHFGYCNGEEWDDPSVFMANADGTRLYRTDTGLSSITIHVLDTSSDTISILDERNVGSYQEEPVFINSTSTSLYVGDIRLDPDDLSVVLGAFPENIWAATGDDRLCFAKGHVYQPTWGTALQAMPVDFDSIAIGENDRYLYCFDKGLLQLHVLRVNCAADTNGDGVIDSRDVILFLGLWAGSDPDGDFNADGVINTQDVLAYLNAFAAGC